MLVKEVMRSPVLTLSVEDSFKDALRLMDQNKVTSLPVTDRSGLLVGIVSEADLLRARVPRDPRTHMIPRTPAAPQPIRVSELMSKPITVSADSDVGEAAELMVATAVKSLPVVDAEHHVVGILSRSDIVHLMARPDDQIRAEILDLLRGAELRCAEVEVNNGIVSLRSPDDPDSQDALRAVALAVRGVVSVEVLG